MDTQPKEENTPQKTGEYVDTHRDGALSVKVWRNYSREGNAYYNVTTQRTYTDKETGEYRDTKNLRPSDLPKLPRLLDKGYETIENCRKQDRQFEKRQEQQIDPQPQQQQSLGLEAQREETLTKAAPAQVHSKERDAPTPER